MARDLPGAFERGFASTLFVFTTKFHLKFVGNPNIFRTLNL